MKNLRKSEAQFREKLRKLRLRQNSDFLIKKTCINELVVIESKTMVFKSLIEFAPPYLRSSGKIPKVPHIDYAIH